MASARTSVCRWAAIWPTACRCVGQPGLGRGLGARHPLRGGLPPGQHGGGPAVEHAGVGLGRAQVLQRVPAAVADRLQGRGPADQVPRPGRAPGRSTARRGRRRSGRPPPRTGRARCARSRPAPGPPRPPAGPPATPGPPAGGGTGRRCTPRPRARRRWPAGRPGRWRRPAGPRSGPPGRPSAATVPLLASTSAWLGNTGSRLSARAPGASGATSARTSPATATARPRARRPAAGGGGQRRTV